MVGYKTSLSQFKKTEIISNIISDQNTINVENNDRRRIGRFTNMWKLNNTFLNNQQVKDEIKREIKKYIETNENGNTKYQNLWDPAKAVLKREGYSRYISTLRKKERL